MTDASPLDRFRTAVMADDAIQMALAQASTAEAFTALAVDWANAQGIPLSPEDLQAGLRPDPLGILAFGAAPQSGPAWPPRGWLPSRTAQEAGFAVDWFHYAGNPMIDPFFVETRSRAGARPFNQLFRYRTDFFDFIKADRDGAVPPSGFIFHMSRCGSTLVSQMLAALPDTIMVSEPEALDTMIQLPMIAQGVTQELHIEAIRAVIAALGRDRTGSSSRYFVKMDSWHTLALPAIRAAFPDVPWIFLYREPIEVLVSQQRQRGTQTAPGVLPPHIFGITEDPMSLSDIDYIARILAATNQAVVDHWQLGGGIAVNYRDLPEAMFTRILPHFGIDPTAEERALLDAASGRDAKAPGTHFKPDSAKKREEANPAAHAAAENYMAEIHARLEALSASSPL